MARRWISIFLAMCLVFGTMSTMVHATEADTPTTAPTEAPTQAPTEEPTQAPTEEPTQAPTEEPTTAPTEEPTTAPTEEPTTAPTEEPTTAPTEEPTTAPTEEPTEEPTNRPVAPQEPAPTTGECGDTMTWSFDEDTGKLTISGSGAMDDFAVMPWGAWKNKIKSIEFGADIRSITKNAFSGCKSVKTIRFLGHAPGTIGNNAFKGITAKVYYPGLDAGWATMEKKNYGGNLTWTPEVPGGKGGVFGNNFVWHLDGSTLKIVGKGNMGGWQSGVENPPWYEYRDDVKKVVMSGSIYCIYTGAFRDMPNLTEVVWPDDLNIIYSSAFYNCTGLTELDIPNSVYTISDYAFYNCANLEEVDMPNALKELGRNAFTNCKALTSINLPNGLSSLGQKAFSHSGIQSIIIPEKITKLSTATFQGCRNLKSISFRGNITEIGKECFESCGKLMALELPASLKTIGENAFANSGLNEVVFGGKMPTIGAGAFTGVKAAVFYPKDDTSWDATRLEVLEKTYAKNLTFYAGTPDDVEEETEAPTETTEPATEETTEPATEEVTETPTDAPAEEVTETPTEPATDAPATEAPAETPTDAPATQEPAGQMSLLDYWPLAVAAVWFFGGSALAIYLLLIRPRRRKEDDFDDFDEFDDYDDDDDDDDER